MSPHRNVDIRPGVNILSVLPHLKYKTWYALGEFVDNAVQSFLDNRRSLEEVEGEGFTLQVDIELDPNQGSIRVRDNAAGIDATTYPRAFRPAAVPPHGQGLSEFGMGMKSAACWFAPRWSVRTSALGEEVERTIGIDVSEIVAEELEEIEVEEQPARADQHYTEVRLEDVHQMPRTSNLGKIKEHLASIYRRFLRYGEIEIHVDGQPLEHKQPEVLEAPLWRDPDGPIIRWWKEVNVELDDGRRAEGFVAIRETGSTSHAGLALLRRNRLIEGSGDEPYRPVEIFGASNSFASQRVFGELDLIGFDVSHTKDGVSWEGAEEEFIRKLKDQMNDESLPILRQAKEYRSGPSVRVGREAKRALERATGQLEAPLSGAFEGSEEPPSIEDPEPSQGPPEISEEEPQGSAEPHATRRTFMIRGAGQQDWEVTVELREEGNGRNWLEVQEYANDLHERPRTLVVSLDLAHPFMARYCVTEDALEGFTRLAVGLIIAETRARDGGNRRAGDIRRNLNELLRLALVHPPEALEA